MTTIVYANGVMASDSQMSQGNVPCSGSTKKMYDNQYTIVGFAGSVAQCLKIVEWVLDYGADPEAKPDLTIYDEPNYDVIIVDKASGKCWTYEGVNLDYIPTSTPVAIGSGCYAAMGAIRTMELLKHPVDAKTAVKIAMKCDVFTGGAIKAISTNKKPKKIKKESNVQF